MTQDKIGNQLGLDTADFWSTCKMGLVIYLTVPRISRGWGGGIKQSTQQCVPDSLKCGVSCPWGPRTWMNFSTSWLSPVSCLSSQSLLVGGTTLREGNSGGLPL